MLEKRENIYKNALKLFSTLQGNDKSCLKSFPIKNFHKKKNHKMRKDGRTLKNRFHVAMAVCTATAWIAKNPASNPGRG